MDRERISHSGSSDAWTTCSFCMSSSLIDSLSTHRWACLDTDECVKPIQPTCLVCVCVFSNTEAASRAIVQFLEVNQSEEASRGWMLLTTINLLASSGQVRVPLIRVPKTVLSQLYDKKIYIYIILHVLYKEDLLFISITTCYHLTSCCLFRFLSLLVPVVQIQWALLSFQPNAIDKVHGEMKQRSSRTRV